MVAMDGKTVYDEFTPVPLTAEALAQLASQDHGYENVARMMAVSYTHLRAHET